MASAFGSSPVQALETKAVRWPKRPLVQLGLVSQVLAVVDYTVAARLEWAQRAQGWERDPQFPSRPSLEPAHGAARIAVLSRNGASELPLAEVEDPMAPHASSCHPLLGPCPLNQSCPVLPAGSSNF